VCFVDIPYDVHLIATRPLLLLLLIALLRHEAELLLLAMHLLLLLCPLGLGLLEEVIVLCADFVLEELIIGILIVHQQKVVLFFLLRQLQPILLLLQPRQLHLQPFALAEEADSTTLLQLFCTKLW